MRVREARITYGSMLAQTKELNSILNWSKGEFHLETVMFYEESGRDGNKKHGKSFMRICERLESHIRHGKTAEIT